MIQPKVYVSPKVFNTFKYWESLAKGEVSAMGKVIVNNGMPYVHSITLLKQKCSTTETEINENALNKALYELREVKGTLSCWMHSHNTMPTFWSATDYEAMIDFGLNGWVISIVTNNDGDIKCSIYHGGDDEVPQMYNEDVEVIIGEPLMTDYTDQLEKDFKKLVTEIKPVLIPYQHGRELTTVGKEDDKPLPAYQYLVRPKNCIIPKKKWDDCWDSYYFYYGAEPFSVEEMEEHYEDVFLNPASIKKEKK